MKTLYHVVTPNVVSLYPCRVSTIQGEPRTHHTTYDNKNQSHMKCLGKRISKSQLGEAQWCILPRSTWLREELFDARRSPVVHRATSNCSSLFIPEWCLAHVIIIYIRRAEFRRG